MRKVSFIWIFLGLSLLQLVSQLDIIQLNPFIVVFPKKEYQGDNGNKDSLPGR